MCDVREWGDGAAAVSGWSKKGGERKILGGWIQTRGLFCRLKAPVCLEQMDYCLLSPGEWVLRIFLVPRVAHSLSHTSPLCLLLSLGLCYTLFCLLLFCGSLCISLLLTFSHTKTDRLFSLFFMGGGHFSPCGLFCVVWGTSWKAGCDRGRMLSRAVPACSVAVPP